MSTATVRLKSSDDKIVLVDQDVIKQMVTIQTMLDSLGLDESSNEEVIPIFTVNSKVLEIVIEWSKHCSGVICTSIDKTWSDHFFKMNLEYVLQLVEAADYLEVESLLMIGQDFIDNHFDEIVTTEAFLSLAPEKLELLISRDTLDVPNEEIIFNSLVSWISADTDERSKTNLEDLVLHIRAHFLSVSYIEEKVKPFLMKRNHTCHLLNYEKRIPRKGYEEYMIAYFNAEGDEGAKCLKYLDPKPESWTWTHLTDIPPEFSRSHGFKLCIVANNIYLVGGWDEERGSYNIVAEYNLSNNTWRKMANLEFTNSFKLKYLTYY